MLRRERSLGDCVREVLFNGLPGRGPSSAREACAASLREKIDTKKAPPTHGGAESREDAPPLGTQSDNSWSDVRDGCRTAAAYMDTWRNSVAAAFRTFPAPFMTLKWSRSAAGLGRTPYKAPRDERWASFSSKMSSGWTPTRRAARAWSTLPTKLGIAQSSAA